MGTQKSGIKQRILCAALALFAERGFTETTMREIGEAAGIRAQSLYTHFNSKACILEHLLEDYKQYASNMKPSEESWGHLNKNAVAEDVIACLTLYFPKDAEHYLKTIVMLFQEQCRNETIRVFMTKDFIIWHEHYITNILTRLVSVGALTRDIDIAFWANLHASLNYASMARFVLEISEAQPDFKGKRMEEMKRTMYETIFRLYGTKDTAAE